jgi:cell division septation protein DedD
MPPPASVMVQVAMVSHPEDAEVLVNALRKRGYTVTAQRKPEDGLIHVWIGPFSSRDEAERWRLKLLDDGYNAIVQQ